MLSTAQAAVVSIHHDGTSRMESFGISQHCCHLEMESRLQKKVTGEPTLRRLYYIQNCVFNYRPKLFEFIVLLNGIGRNNELVETAETKKGVTLNV